MVLKRIMVAILAALGLKQTAAAGRFVGRARTGDAYANGTAIPYRMNAGFPGDVNRTHPVSIEPVLLDATNPPPSPGFPVLVNSSTNGVRQLLAGDTAVTTLYGVMVRNFPVQQSTTSQAYGAIDFGVGQLVPSQPNDCLRFGYINVQLPAGAAAVTKGAPVFVWIAASSGAHVQGGFESSASSGNTIALDVNRYMFNGPADANGVVELYVR